MATDPKTIVPLPFAGGGQGYTRQADGSFALDVTVVAGADTSAPLQYSGPSGGLVDQNDAVIFPAAAGLRNFMTDLQYLNTSATAGEIVIKDGSAIIWRGYAPGSMDSPANVTFRTPLRGSVNTAMSIAVLMGQMAVRVSAQGFRGT